MVALVSSSALSDGSVGLQGQPDRIHGPARFSRCRTDDIKAGVITLRYEIQRIYEIACDFQA